MEENRSGKHEYLRKDYLKDKPTVSRRAGLSQTRFHNGFYRRPVYKIKTNESEKEEKMEARHSCERPHGTSQARAEEKHVVKESRTEFWQVTTKQKVTSQVRGRRNFNVVLTEKHKLKVKSNEAIK